MEHDIKYVRQRLPILVKISLLTLLFPAYFSIGSLEFSPSKVLFLLTVPFLMFNLFCGKYGRILAEDLLILAYVLWMAIAMFANHTLGVAVEYMGANSLILLGGYLTARATIRTKDNFVALAKFFTFLIILSLPFAIYESTTGMQSVPRWLEKLPGITSHEIVQHGKRMGLWRTQWVFAHPIHYGLFCSIGFSIAFVSMKGIWSNTKRYILSGIVATCCFLSISSGPVLSLAAQIGLISWAWALNFTGMRWKILGWLAAIGYTIAELSSSRMAIYAIVERISFDPSTANARKVLFEYGVQQINRAPIFGVGYHPWPLPAWLSGSIDNFWLLLAVIFGLPTFIFFSAAFMSAMVAIGRRDLSKVPDLESIRLGWMFVMASLILSLSTVAVWGEMYTIVLFVLGSGIWLKTVELGPVNTFETPADMFSSLSRYTRFSTRPRVKNGGSFGVSKNEP